MEHWAPRPCINVMLGTRWLGKQSASACWMDSWESGAERHQLVEVSTIEGFVERPSCIQWNLT